MSRIYLDYASITPIDPRVLVEMKKYSTVQYANPSSLYKEGVMARTVLDTSRTSIGRIIHALPDEIVFTSGGTEANTLAIEGVIKAARREFISKPHIIVSAIEHSSIMELVRALEKEGVDITRIPVSVTGLVSIDDIKKAIRPETVLVSVMYVNNEIGTIQPIREIARGIRQARSQMKSVDGKEQIYPLFHSDAAQAPQCLEINVDQLGVDLMTLDGGKIYGPRSIGCLYIKRDTPIEPVIYGGGQERGFRSGTENVPAIAGFAKALELVDRAREKESVRINELKSYFMEEIKKIKSDITINGGGIPNILNISIPGIDNEFFLFQLDAKDVAVSTKSSCLRDEDESYVLKAIGADNKTSIRFSFGRWTKKADIKKVIRIIRGIIQ